MARAPAVTSHHTAAWCELWKGESGCRAAGASGQAAEEEAGEERPMKRARKPKEYIPQVGSANYAFLITLLQVRHHIALPLQGSWLPEATRIGLVWSHHERSM